MEFVDSDEEEKNEDDFFDNEKKESSVHIEKWIDSKSGFTEIKDKSLSSVYECKKSTKSSNTHRTNESNSKETLDEEDLYKGKILHTFSWKEGGEEVKVTGSFCEWKQIYNLTKDPNDQIFRYSILLDNNKYEYKYIVDGVWKCSNNEPTIKDNCGNTNNIIDLTNITPKVKSKHKKNGSSNKKAKKDDSKHSKNLSEKGESKEEYNRRVPERNELDEDVPSTNDFYSIPFPLISSSSKVKRKGKYLSYYTSESYSQEASQKPLKFYGHVTTNHTLTEGLDGDITKIGACYRYREKTTTFIFYKNPKT